MLIKFPCALAAVQLNFYIYRDYILTFHKNAFNCIECNKCDISWKRYMALIQQSISRSLMLTVYVFTHTAHVHTNLVLLHDVP